MFRTRLLIDAQSNSLKLSDGAHDLNLVDLEFLHNYCTSTALTLHRDPPTIRLWSITVPEFGFIHDYVMHGVLALSALHLGYDGAHDLNLVDLEFLHNYCTSTALTLHRDPPTIRLWSITVPEFGFIHDYVMHGVLALSALHLGYVSLPIHLFTECQTSP